MNKIKTKNKFKKILGISAVALTATATALPVYATSDVYAYETNDNIMTLSNSDETLPVRVINANFDGQKLIIQMSNFVEWTFSTAVVDGKEYKTDTSIQYSRENCYYLEIKKIDTTQQSFNITKLNFTNEQDQEGELEFNLKIVINKGTVQSASSSIDSKVASTGTIFGENQNNVIGFNLKLENGDKVTKLDAIAVDFDLYHIVSETDIKQSNIPNWKNAGANYVKFQESYVKTDRYNVNQIFQTREFGQYYCFGNLPNSESMVTQGRNDVHDGCWYDYTSADFYTKTDFSTGKTTYYDGTSINNLTIGLIELKKNGSTTAESAYKSQIVQTLGTAEYNYAFVVANDRSGIESWNAITFLYETESGTTAVGTFNEKGLHAITNKDGSYAIYDKDGNNVSDAYVYDSKTGSISDKNGNIMNDSQRITYKVPSDAHEPGDEIEEGTHEGDKYGWFNKLKEKIKEIFTKNSPSSVAKDLFKKIAKIVGIIFGCICGLWLVKALISAVISKIFK